VAINMRALTMNVTVTVEGLWVAVNRDMTTTKWGELVDVPAWSVVLDSGSTVNTKIYYHERETRMWNGGYRNFFSTSLQWHQVGDEDSVDSPEPEGFSKNSSDDDQEGGWIDIKFCHSMMIEHWEEYVDFDYYDWCSWMGGIMSLSSFFFFWGAYYLAVYFGDNSTMGILPEMSFIFDNFETVHLLKRWAKRV